MSFNFEWPTFSEAFYADAREMLAQALNKGPKPPIIADRIEVTELNMGTLPPELEILEIGDLSTDRFRGIFRLTYAGDAYIALQTKVQANPLNVPRPSLDILGSPRILFAAAPLDVPMTLKLSSLSLRAIVVLVVSRQKGITLVFKNDPLESVSVSSSFDGVDSVAGYIQREIEGQLREAFRSDLPSIIHRLSQKWLSGEVKSANEGPGFKGQKSGKSGFDKDAKIETRTAYVPGGESGKAKELSNARGRGVTRKMSSSMNSVAGASVSIASSEADTTFSISSARRHSLLARPSTSRRASMQPPLRDDTQQSVPESIESYDPTYGLRPDSIPQHAGFGEYERLVRSGATGRGLGDILGITEEDEEDGEMGEFDDSFDMIGLVDLVDDGSGARVPEWETSPTAHRGRHQPQHSYSSYSFNPNATESNAASSGYETIPAVGGGTITRPRIFHTQSQMRTRTASSGSLSAHGSPSTMTIRGAGGGDSESGTETEGGGTASRPPSYGQLENRFDYLGGMGASAPGSRTGSSTPRFPFPKYGPTANGLGRANSSPSLMRGSSNLGMSMGMSLGRRSTLLSSSNSTSPENTRRSSSMLRSSLSPYSSPPSSIPSPPLPPSPEIEEEAFPPPRPDPIDLLSRSPSSVLNNSFDGDLPITLNPAASDSCAHLATLTSSNQTLSPFTRAHEHFTARSSPHVFNRPAAIGRGFMATSSSVSMTSRMGEGKGETEKAPAVAKRKRIHRIGSAKLPPSTQLPVPHTPQRVNSYGSGGTATGTASRQRSPVPSELGEYFPQMKMMGASQNENHAAKMGGVQRKKGVQDLRREMDADADFF